MSREGFTWHAKDIFIEYTRRWFITTL